MVRWTSPVGPFRTASFLSAVILWYLLGSLRYYFEFGTRWLVGVGMVYTVVGIVGVGLIRAAYKDIYHHQASRWPLPEDKVVQDLARAMAARGARPPREVVGKWTWFDLPPLSICVRRWLWWTTVYVGPTTEENEREVEGLKAFVERALAKTSS